ncbi:MAG: LysM peptidoglycan-binding domain-containing protein [Candidatus Muiribacteriaceae bacterium]
MDKRMIIVVLVVLVLIFIGVRSCGGAEDETVLPEEEMQATFDEEKEVEEKKEPVYEEEEYVYEEEEEEKEEEEDVDLSPKTEDIEIEDISVREEVKKTNKVEEKEEDFYYIVRPGDTLWSLSLEYYIDPYKYNNIAEHNQISDPERIYPGMRIDFPGKIIRRDYLYTVKADDTLWEIAGNVYDDNSMWKFLAGYNGIDIGDRIIWKGMTLRIPFDTKKYVAKKGDDLFSISEKIYDSHYFAYKLMQYNNLDDMHWVRPGTEIYYPVIDYRK